MPSFLLQFLSLSVNGSSKLFKKSSALLPCNSGVLPIGVAKILPPAYFIQYIMTIIFI